jgi:hypothetical protein
MAAAEMKENAEETFGKQGTQIEVEDLARQKIMERRVLFNN